MVIAIVRRGVSIERVRRKVLTQKNQVKKIESDRKISNSANAIMEFTI